MRPHCHPVARLAAAHRAVLCSLMEPKSIRAKTTLIYKTELIRDAFELHQQGRSLSASDADRYLLPPALLQQYHQDLKPRPAGGARRAERLARAHAANVS